MRKASLLILACCVEMTIACGGLGDPKETAPLAVIGGTLRQQSTSTPPSASNTRLAVLWTTSNTGYKSAYDIPVEPVFPSSFRIELSSAPPVEAMKRPSAEDPPASTVDHPSGVAKSARPLDVNPSSNLAYAVGSIVAYEDLNGNGTLDLIDADSPPIDRVLGVNDELLIVYVEGDPSVGLPRASGTPMRGYNLLRQPRCRVADPPRNGVAPKAPEPACEPTAWLSITTLYDLPLTADPQFSALMCASASTTTNVSPTTSNVKPGDAPPPAPGPAGWPTKTDPRLGCDKTGRTYSLVECTSTSLGLCKDSHESCASQTFGLPSTPPPAEWPCTVQ